MSSVASPDAGALRQGEGVSSKDSLTSASEVSSIVGLGISIFGLIVSGTVAWRLGNFRKEVLLRGALEDLEKKLGGVAKNLSRALKDSRSASSELSVLRVHAAEIRGKSPKGSALVGHAQKVIELLDEEAATPKVISSVAALQAALGHYRRDQRWKL